MREPAWYRAALRALDDEALALKCLRVLRVDSFDQADSWQAAELCFEFRRRGCEGRYLTLLAQVKQECRDWRSWNAEQARQLRKEQ